MSSFVDSVNMLANRVAYNNALNTQTNLSVDFINKFGSYSNNFSQITPIGGEKHFWFYIYIFKCYILFYIKRRNKRRRTTK